MKFAYFPDLPDLPDWPLNPTIESHYRSLITNTENSSSHDRWAVRYNIDQKIVDWVKENIDPDFDSIGLNHHRASTTSNIKHVDRTRNWILTWILDTGGDDVHTVFWKEKGSELERDPGCYSPTTHDMVEVDRLLLKPRQWTLLNGTVIHSVENIQSTRKSIQIGFWNDSPFVLKYTTQQ
jgi:hypothetical protein